MTDDELCPHGYPEDLCDDCYAYWRAAGERFADDRASMSAFINPDEVPADNARYRPPT